MKIKDKIHTIRGLRVILDEDLAKMYSVNIKRLNEQVKRNIVRFPENFMFQLTINENNRLRSQFATLDNNSVGKHRKYLPYVFTEQGIAMLSGVLRSETAIKVSIQIMNAFVEMRKFISKNVEIFYRIENIERKQIEFEKIFNQLDIIKPKKGIFFEGQIFDAYKLVSDIIKTAKRSITLIDNYIDESVLTLLSKNQIATIKILTNHISEQLSLDLKKYNSQYKPITSKEFHSSHDRFLIIDNDIYHFGASLKDLGKKWFAFSKFDREAITLLKEVITHS